MVGNVSVSIWTMAASPLDSAFVVETMEPYPLIVGGHLRTFTIRPVWSLTSLPSQPTIRDAGVHWSPSPAPVRVDATNAFPNALRHHHPAIETRRTSRSPSTTISPARWIPVAIPQAGCGTHRNRRGTKFAQTRKAFHRKGARPIE